MLLQILFRLLDQPKGVAAGPQPAVAGLLVRLRPEHARVYPRVPAGVWLPAHRRHGDDGMIWLNSKPDPSGEEDLPLCAAHVEIRTRGAREFHDRERSVLLPGTGIES